MKKTCRKRSIVIMALLLVVCACLLTPTVKAASNKRKSVEKAFWFPVPNGGHSSARIRLTYVEYYSIKDGKSVFSRRTRNVLFQRAGATSLPTYGYGILKHSNGKNFSKWKKQDVIYGSQWNAASSYENTAKVTYSRNTTVKGTLNATVSCSGAVVPTRAVSVTQTLNMK